jgi:hypothetical protein
MHQFSPLTTTYFFASHQQSGNTSSSKPLSLGPYPSYIQQQQRYIGESMETTGVLPPVFGVPFLPCPNYPPPIPNPEVFSPQGRVPLKEHNGEDGEDVPTNKMESLNLSPKDTSSVEGRFEGLPIFVIPQSGPQAGVLLPNAYKRAMVLSFLKLNRLNTEHKK